MKESDINFYFGVLLFIFGYAIGMVFQNILLFESVTKEKLIETSFWSFISLISIVAILILIYFLMNFKIIRKGD